MNGTHCPLWFLCGNLSKAKHKTCATPRVSSESFVSLWGLWGLTDPLNNVGVVSADGPTALSNAGGPRTAAG